MRTINSLMVIDARAIDKLANRIAWREISTVPVLMLATRAQYRPNYEPIQRKFGALDYHQIVTQAKVAYGFLGD